MSSCFGDAKLQLYADFHLDMSIWQQEIKVWFSGRVSRLEKPSRVKQMWGKELK